MKTPTWFLRKNLIAWLLLPVSVVYFIASYLVYFYRLFRQKSSKTPVICIGGLLAGGVGKTPIVREIAKKTGSAVVLRGYKGGDEARMLSGSGLSVFVGADRLQSIKSAEKAGFASIVMDDGFQNPSIKKDISILVFDGKIGVGNSFILPAGPLRQPLCAVRRADAIIIIGNKNQLIARDLKKFGVPIFYAENKTILPVKIRKFIAFAGIGYPEKFFDGLSVKPIKTLSFPDHYEYTASDIKKLLAIADAEKSGLLTTEKDWVRLPVAVRRKIKFAALETTISDEFYSWLEKQMVIKK